MIESVCPIVSEEKKMKEGKSNKLSGGGFSRNGKEICEVLREARKKLQKKIKSRLIQKSVTMKALA